MDRQTDLYEDDFYLWTQSQAEALRAAERAGGRSNAIEWARLAEEVEDLGKRDLKAALSLTARILEHLYLLQAGGRAEPKGHWRGEIKAFRRDLAAELTPSIRVKVEAALEALHVSAADVASEKSAAHEPEVALDPTLRWTLPQILGESNDPLESR